MNNDYVVEFKCTNIDWDVEGRGVYSLPEETTVEIGKARISEFTSFDDIKCEVINELSDRYGYRVIDCTCECISNQA